jgi:hypothetical protein
MYFWESKLLKYIVKALIQMNMDLSKYFRTLIEFRVQGITHTMRNDFFSYSRVYYTVETLEK